MRKNIAAILLAQNKITVEKKKSSNKSYKKYYKSSLQMTKKIRLGQDLYH